MEGVEHELDPVGVDEGAETTLLDDDGDGALEDGGGGAAVVAAPGKHCLRTVVG